MRSFLTNTGLCFRFIGCVSIFLSGITPVLQCIEYAPATEINAGGFWRDLPKVVGYEASIPLIYRADWETRDLPPLRESHCDSEQNLRPKWSGCKTVRQIEELEEIFRDEMGKTLTEELSAPKRSRRSLDFIGSTLDWCCGVATTKNLHSLNTKQEDVSNRLYHLQSDLGKELTALINNSKAFDQYQKMSAANFNEVEKRIHLLEKNHIEAMKSIFDEDLQGRILLHKILQNIKHNILMVRLVRRNNIISTCKSNQLPYGIVEPKVLSQDLLRLEKNLSKSGYQLAVSTNDIQNYYQLPFVDCAFSQEVVTITIKVPITRTGHKWHLKELLTVPFSWQNQTCEVPIKSLFLAVASVDGKEILRAVGGTDKHACRPFSDQLCFIPRYGNHVGSTLCAFKLFTGVAVRELGNFCPMTCLTTNALSISEIRPDTFVLTNAPVNTHIECNGSDTQLPPDVFGKPGAVKVTFPCNCKLMIGLDVVIPSRFPCTLEQKPSLEVTHLLPAVWSKLGSFIVQPVHRQVPPRYSNMTDVIDVNWNLRVPHVNISDPYSLLRDLEENMMPTPTYGSEFSHHGDSILFIWNTVLSIVLCWILYRTPLLWLPAALPHRGASADIGLTGAQVILGTGGTLFCAFLGALIFYLLLRCCPNKIRTQEQQRYAIVRLDTEKATSSDETG